ncbi:peptide chain release factor N(5)-glutamine methyltransferase [Jatrophihabitans fulvus]
MGTTRSGLVTLDAVDPSAAQRFEAWVARRAAREPLQHLTGRAPFRHLELAVGPGVFVPRPETELLVDAVLQHLRSAHHPLAVDLCAGSGALAAAIADEVPGATVVAVENSPDALPWLRRNAGDGVAVLDADVRDDQALAGYAGRADAVVSNPPYVPSASEVSPEVRADPAVAVFGGPDGLDLMSSVIRAAALLLRPGGVVAIEHDDTHGEAVPGLLATDGRFAAITAHRDLAGRPRYATAVRSGA